MSLEALIKNRIRETGAMSVAEYMSLCLAHPEHGYYMKRDPLGAEGDFTTSPEISQIFGELLGLWLAAQWQKQGKQKATLVELGPGRGTLMVDMLRATKKVAGFHEAISVHLVETSPVLKQKQWQALAGKHPRIEWHESIDTLPELPIFMVANEFFDALPIRQFCHPRDLSRHSVATAEGGDPFAHERMIGLNENNELIFLDLRLRGDDIKETCEPAQSIITHLSSLITKHSGAALIIDYGYTEGHGNTLQALKNHAYHPVLENAGNADLTAHVDFSALKQSALAVGAKVFGAIPQGKFLLKIGASQRLQNLCAGANEEQSKTLMSGFERLIAPEAMGELFKVMAVLPERMEYVEGF